MWNKHRSVLQDHVKYIHNDIVKSFRVMILQYIKSLHDMHELAKYLPPPSMKGEIFKSASWGVCDKELYENEIRVEDKDGIPTSIHD